MMRVIFADRTLVAKKETVITTEELRQLGVALGCRTQTALAARLGISQARVSQALSGSHPIKRGALLTLIRELQDQHLVVIGRRQRAARRVAK